MTDADLSPSMSMGVARDCRAPARATFIIDRTGTMRYMMVHRSDIGRSVKEILRLVVQAFMYYDLTGEAVASAWIPGGEVIPTDFSKKVEYFVNKFGHGNKEKTDDGNTEANDATATAKIEASPEDEAAAAEPDEKSDTKSKIVIAEVHNSEAAKEDEASAASFKSAEIPPTGETGSDPKAGVEEQKVEK
jgi:hypothetical protein